MAILSVGSSLNAMGEVLLFTFELQRRREHKKLVCEVYHFRFQRRLTGFAGDWRNL
jgi:hypothetical protein